MGGGGSASIDVPKGARKNRTKIREKEGEGLEPTQQDDRKRLVKRGGRLRSSSTKGTGGNIDLARPASFLPETWIRKHIKGSFFPLNDGRDQGRKKEKKATSRCFLRGS